MERERLGDTSELDIDYAAAIAEDDEDFHFSLEATAVDTASATSASIAGIKTKDLQTLIRDFSSLLNEAAIIKSTGLPTRTPTAQYKGFAAEEFFKLTAKINALAEGAFSFQVGIYTGGTLPDGSVLKPNDPRVDISVWTRKRIGAAPERTLEVQAKIHNRGRESQYLKDMRTPRYSDVTMVGAEGQDILPDKFSFNVGNQPVTNDSLSPEEAAQLAESMKAQQAPQYERAEEKRKQLDRSNLKDAIVAGAVTGAIASLIEEVLYTIKNRGNTEEDFIEAIKRILCGAVEGGIEGAVRSGAIMSSVQIIGKALGKDIDMNGPGAIPVMAITNLAVDLAKDLYGCFVTGTVSADDLLNRTVDKTFSSFSSFGGAWAIGKVGAHFAAIKESAATGAAIGSWFGPVGTIVGTVVGGLVINISSNLIIKVAESDAKQRVIECIHQIEARIEAEGCEKHYAFVDGLAELSDVRLSFKGLLPCYNLISDLKEYSLRKKKLLQILAQIENSTAEADAEKKAALRVIEQQETEKIKLLRIEFEQKRADMSSRLRDSVETYVSNSYFEYMSLYDVMSGNTLEMEQSLRRNVISHNAILDSLRNRVQVNQELNELLDEMMKDEQDRLLLESIIKRLRYYMDRDEMIVGKQYISYDEALSLVGEVS